jgi:hypothetical protein
MTRDRTRSRRSGRRFMRSTNAAAVAAKSGRRPVFVNLGGPPRDRPAYSVFLNSRRFGVLPTLPLILFVDALLTSQPVTVAWEPSPCTAL